MSTTTEQAAADPRFTLGLALDVARVLGQHGYDGISTDGHAVMELQAHLFHFLHGRAGRECMGGVRECQG
jgi:hypothetical protein